MSTDDDAQVASSILEEAGQFCFIFPGVGQIAGGALTFLGGILGLAATQPSNPGPSNAELQKDITKVGALVKATLTQGEVFDIQKSLDDAKTELDTFHKDFQGALKDRHGTLVQTGDDEPDLVTSVKAFDLNKTPLREALAGMAKLTTHADRVHAINLYCSTKTKSHTQAQKNLQLLREIYKLNYDYQVNGKYPNRHDFSQKWDDWYNPPSAHQHTVNALKTSLTEAIAYIEPELIALKKSFRSRLSRAQAAAKTDDVPGQRLKKEWDAITKNEFLDQISESCVDTLLGTPTAMGVVDLWKETLETLWKSPYKQVPFVRGDKLDPPRALPCCWFNPADTKIISKLAVSGKGDAIALLKQKRKSKLDKNDRPFVGPFRKAPPSARVLTLVVVNTTADPLLIDSIEITHGGMISNAIVGEYSQNNISTHDTKGYAQKVNTDSADKASWVEAAPLTAMGKGTAAVGVWQFVGVLSDQRSTFCIKFKGLPKTGYQQLYIGGEMPLPGGSSKYTASIGISDHGTPEQYINTWIDGKGTTTDHSSSCYASVTPVDVSDPALDIVLTALVA